MHQWIARWQVTSSEVDLFGLIVQSQEEIAVRFGSSLVDIFQQIRGKDFLDDSQHYAPCSAHARVRSFFVSPSFLADELVGEGAQGMDMGSEELRSHELPAKRIGVSPLPLGMADV